jgi:phenylalanyl-tRNA synthetase beta chain
MAKDLTALGFGVVDTLPAGETAAAGAGAGAGANEVPLVVSVPTRRRDVTREVDLIEEVARAFGYDRLPDVPLVSGGAVGDRSPEWRLKDLARTALLGLGFSECRTPSLDDPERLALTWPMLHEGEPRLARIQNAAGPETSALRSDLISGLLRVAAHNLRHGAAGLRLFEIGRVFVARGANDPPTETTQLAALVCGPRFEFAWDGGQAESDFFEAKGLWEAFLARLGVDRVEWAPYPARGWKSGEAAELRAKVRVACAGRIRPLLARRLDLDVPVFLFAAELDALGRARRETTRFTDFPRLPGVRRDVAFFLPADVPHGRIESLLRKSGGALLTDVRLFDVYQGKGVPEGKKSLAYTLTFQAADRTLQESEIESLQRTMVETLGSEVGAVLRDR